MNQFNRKINCIKIRIILIKSHKINIIHLEFLLTVNTKQHSISL